MRKEIAERSLGLRCATLEGLEFYSVSKSGTDGCKWQHGASIEYFDGWYYVSFGRNKGEENTKGEECVVCRSQNLTCWEKHAEFCAEDDGMGYSHGSISAVNGKIYLFAPYFAGSDRQSPTGIRFLDLSMRVFVFNDGKWERLICDAPDFWPLQQPQRLKNGNYIIAGINGLWQASVALSNGDDLTSWEVVVPPYGENTAFTESNCVVDGDKITLFVRNERSTDADDVTAGVAYSYDFGKTWTEIAESNLPANTSKICAGKLQNGNTYVVGNSIKGANRRRDALTIAVACDDKFTRLFKIRDRAVPDSLTKPYDGITDQEAMSYPFAMEKDGKLYVVYSSFMTKGCNYNNIELCVIDLDKIKGS